MVSIRDKAVVRRADEEDLRAMAEINTASFSGNRGDVEKALEWMQCWFRAYPLYQYFSIQVEGKVAGYVGWQIHGGFLREHPILELEQIALKEEFRNQKLGPLLIHKSMGEVLSWMSGHNSRMRDEIVGMVWAYATNTNALKAYEEDFPDGVKGMREQYDGRTEVMFRRVLKAS